MNAIPIDLSKIKGEISDPDKPVYIKNKYGPFKFRDIKYPAYSISDTKGTAFAVQEIILRKVPGETNKIEVVLIMPNPEEIDIVYKNTAPKTEENDTAKEESVQVGTNKEGEKA